MKKVNFSCDQCEAEGWVKIGDAYDEYDISYCPCCGAPLLVGDEDDDE